MTCSSRVAFLFVASSLACATSPAATPPGSSPAAPQTSAVAATLNPVGTYDYTATAPDGSTLTGTIIITGSPGAYAGKVERDGLGWTDLTSVTVEGQTLTTTAQIQEGQVVTTATLIGDEFIGKWTLQGFEGTINGKRRTPVASSTSMVATTATLNPIGTFDFSAIGPDGSASNGFFTITSTPGGYVGRIEREGLGGTDLTSIAVEGQVMTLSAVIPEGTVVLTLTFTGTEFAGKWAIPGAEGAITGKRR